MEKPILKVNKKKIIVRWTYNVSKCDVCGGFLDFPCKNDLTEDKKSISTDVFIDGKRGYHLSCIRNNK
jgi:hypothetical protein